MEKEKGVVVIIPAYEPTRDFIDYARAVSETFEALVVVNDGSGDQYDGIFSEIESMEGVTCLSYPENRGKGYALKVAFAYCRDRFPAEYAMITADCDGQHRLEDIKNVCRATLRSKESIILGSRDFSLPCVPRRSYIGNTNIRRIYKFLYGFDINDTQTGLRGFRVSMAEMLSNIGGDRFEYEMGVLIHAAKEGIRVVEIPISTVYPDDPSEHVSHFKTISDSIRMLWVVLKNLNRYLFSSTISAFVDVFAFFILTYFLLDGRNAAEALVATVSARVVSSAFNFSFNRKYVFGGKGKRAVARYYTLWLLQLAASYGMVALLGEGLGIGGVWLSVLKGVWDLLLASVSYSVQRSWVFSRGENRSFYKPYMRFALFLAKRFTRTYRSSVERGGDAKVYVCRHLNMHGPYTTLKWIGFPVHPLVLSLFFDRYSCYRHLSEYTFAGRVGKRPRRFNLFAWVAGLLIPLSVKGVEAVPVYRGSVEAARTFREAMRYLGRGESLILYPDVDYTSVSEEAGEIYRGFLLLGELYKKRYGRSLCFVPLYIDEGRKTIFEGEPVVCNSLKEEGEGAAEALREAIAGTPKI